MRRRPRKTDGEESKQNMKEQSQLQARSVSEEIEMQQPTAGRRIDKNNGFLSIPNSRDSPGYVNAPWRSRVARTSW